MTCLKSDKDSVQRCAELLKQNNILILPTDTVYGFSGIAGKTDDKIRKLKGRSENKPFIQLISSPDDLKYITDTPVPSSLLKLWPGPLTIIVKCKNSDSTVAVRCPGDSWLREIIAETGCPISSTSVNRSGSPVLGKISEIKAEFEKEVSMIVDNGDSKSSVPSTIVSVIDGNIKIIRQGAVEIYL